MKIYSLSGASGTGKSTSAIQFAHDHAIQAIIDDGLLIVGGEKIAGTSAKFEKSALKAVRRAIFEDEVHQQAVIHALHKRNITSVLIIGTSEKMTKRIAQQLNLGEISAFYAVEDIRSPKEIEWARYIRETQGKHVMPVPYRQVEQNFFKRLIIRGKEIFSPNREKIGETTIVLPDFHHQSITIAKSVYLEVAKHVATQNHHVARITQLHCTAVTIPRITMEVYLAAPVHYAVPNAVRQLQQELADSFQFHFNVIPAIIDVKVLGIESRQI